MSNESVTEFQVKQFIHERKLNMATYSNAVRSQYATNTSAQLLSQPVDALIGITNEGVHILEDLGILTVFDLAASNIFNNAYQITLAATQAKGVSNGLVAGDFFDKTYQERQPGVVANAPLSVIRSIGKATAKRIEEAIGAQNIQELANWPPYQTARAILNDAYGLSTTIIDDPERPDDLIPVSRRYATERVQYDIIVMDKVLFEGKNNGDTVNLVFAGAIDISDIVSAALTTRPAIGAVLTYRQSWFPQGLALGHLLHSMALAPGESTRIAMVDWSRTVRAQTDEDTAQAESLIANLFRTRAMSEVTSSVANETQSGFSGSWSKAIQNQSATSGGSAELSGKTILDQIKNGEPVGLRFNSSGSSSASADSTTFTTGWASSSGNRSLNSEMTQNINDRTHQAANSVRNRRATTITESSQKESENLSTRVVTNYNHMHAMTIQYFEVVQVYRVLVELAKVSRCLFVPMKLVTFTPEVLRRFRSVIANSGLIPEIRALSRSQPNNLRVSAPRRARPWSPQDLQSIKAAIGDDVGTTESADIFLPLSGLKFKELQYKNSVADGYDLFVLTKQQGSRFASVSAVTNPPPEIEAEPMALVRIDTVAPQDISQLVLRRKADHDGFNGIVEMFLTFEIFDAQGQPASSRINDTILRLNLPIAFDESQTEVIISEFEQSFAEADIIDHLAQNALHYSSAIWRSLDPATITTMLSSYIFEEQPLIQVIDPVPVAVSGNYILFRLYGNEDGQAWQEFLEKHGLKNPVPVEDFVPLPSGGVFAEAVLGRSNSAEKLDITRFWNWQDSPIPILPPEISPLTAGGKSNDPNPQTAALESPIVNIVNPPALPDPAGLAPLYSAIANGNMFRDMSGLAQTAALAQAALQAAQTGAGQATTAAGQAQQVAAQQLSDLLKIIGQVALAAITGGVGGPAAGAVGGMLGSLLGSGNAGVAKNPTNTGALINHGTKMDNEGKGGTNSSSTNGQNNSNTAPSSSQTTSGSNGGNNSAVGNEGAAFNSALGGSGILGEFMKMVLAATPTGANNDEIPLPHLSLAEKAKVIADQPILVKSYENFKNRIWNWWFSPNSKLASATRKPQKLNNWEQWDNMDWRPRKVLLDLSRLPENLTQNTSNLKQLQEALQDWPDNYFAVFWAVDDPNEDTNPCNLFLGDALTLDGREQITSINKYYNAREVYQGYGKFRQISFFLVSVGDIAAWGNHVEIVTKVNHADGDFCSRAGFHDPIGHEICEKNRNDGLRKLDNPNLRFMRVS